MISYFDTNSCAEFHWLPLHELLIKYHSKTTGDDLMVVREKFSQDTAFRHDLIMKNQHIVSHYFDTRLLNYMNSVQLELFDFSDYWYRYEFAAGRGMIHSHGVIFSTSHAKKIEEALNASPCDSDGNIESSVVSELEKVLQSTNYNDDTFYSPEFVSMHPAGGETVSDCDGNQVWIADKSKWPMPEGTCKPPPHNPLTKEISSVLHLINGIQDMYLEICNKIGLHKCSSYCLRSAKLKDIVDILRKICRFHFGEYDKEKKVSSGKVEHPFHPTVTKGEHPRYEGRRDHPRFLQNMKARLLSWKANCDTQVIIERCLLGLQNYLTGYACKGAASTEDFIQLYRSLIEDADDSNSVKNLSQRLLLKIVGFIDVPAAAADFINTGGRLVRCTRKFNYVGLSGYRQVDTSNTNNVTKDNVLDKFLSEARQVAQPDITLYDWAKACKCYCKCLHVPVFTGALIYPVWPPTEDYSKSALMRYSKGTWKHVDDLKNGYDTFLESFANFLDSDDCPSHVKDMLEEAKYKYNKHQTVNNRRNVNLGNSQSSSQDSLFSSQSSSCKERLNFRESIFNDISTGNFRDANLEIPLNTGGQDFDWHTYGRRCVGGVSIPHNGQGWIDEVSESAINSLYKYHDQLDLPSINVLLANKLQMVAISMVIRYLLKIAKGECPEQLLMLIVGTAGTGKTYVVKVLSRIARRLFARNGAVLNLAPTGAASVLLPDGRTMHSVTPLPRKSKKKDLKTAQVTDYPMNSTQRSTLCKYIGTKDDRKVYLLNKDERGMTSHNDAAWCSQRMKEATLDDEPFGGVPVVCWVGDHGQLGPVGAVDLHTTPKATAPPSDHAGFSLYRQFDNVVYLHETMRQGPDQKHLLESLLRIRRGEIIQNDWMDMNARFEGDLSNVEKANFEHDKVITLCETWSEVDIENYKKLNDLGVPIAVIPSINRGKHTQGKFADKQVGQIPPRALLGVGSRVILTKNQKGLTGHHLNNGAMGTVVAIIYDDNVRPPSFPQFVIVDFPHYNGPAWCREQVTWIPICSEVSFCEYMCCTRHGLPLMPGYSMPIAKSQGSTIGAEHLVTHMRLKLQKQSNFENLCPGTTYTGLSRVDKNSSWALVDKIDWSRLSIINNHATIKRRRDEDDRLKKLHDVTCNRFAITKTQYLDLIKEVDSFCNDGYHDAVCNSKSSNCNCIACNANVTSTTLTNETTSCNQEINFCHNSPRRHSKQLSNEIPPRSDNTSTVPLTSLHLTSSTVNIADIKSVNFATFGDILDWASYYLKYPVSPEKILGHVPKTLQVALNRKVSLLQGDITQLQVDCIVNAANENLQGGGGVDGAIHKAAGHRLKVACQQYAPCAAGNAIITPGFDLPAKYVIHTVGPKDRDQLKLTKCYENSLQIATLQSNIRSIAFPCISTGIYGYPNEDAAHIALSVTRKWLESKQNLASIDCIIFCTYQQLDYSIYKRFMGNIYFPC